MLGMLIMLQNDCIIITNFCKTCNVKCIKQQELHQILVNNQISVEVLSIIKYFVSLSSHFYDIRNKFHIIYQFIDITHIVCYEILAIFAGNQPNISNIGFYIVNLSNSFNLQYLVNPSFIRDNIMKVKFISKKNRELIKTQQDNNHQLKQQINTSKPNQKMIIQYNNANEVKHDDEQDSDRQRSRQKSNLKLLDKKNLTKQQQNQRQQFKKKYLGLTKEEKSNRFNANYKNRFVFDWDDTDDTYKNGGALASFSLENANKMQKRQDLIQKQFSKTWKDKKITQMTERDWRIFREDHEIYVKGGRVCYPMRVWDDLSNLNTTIKQNLQSLNFIKPKPIQMQAIPIGMQLKDLIGIAPTGEGKTLAYLIPALQFILPLERLTPTNYSSGPYVLIMVPSRQLAQQIQGQLLKISKNIPFNEVTVVGGKLLDFQALSIQKGAQIMIGTPGRLRQLIDQRIISFQRTGWVVIDQADKMISENLVQQVQYILKQLGEDSILANQENSVKNRVMHMFSATMTPEIQKLIRTYLVQPNYVSIGDPGSGKKQIQYHVEFVPENNKNFRLGKILRNLMGPLIIFVNMRTKCEPVMKIIQEKWNRRAIDYHSGKNQQQRQRAIQGFRNGKYEILVATDLAGRGLDVVGITAVINYDAPKNINQFVHRAGRTGRAGMKGIAYTFLTTADEGIFYDVCQFLKKNGLKVPQQLFQHPAAQIKPGSTNTVPRHKQIVYTA